MATTVQPTTPPRSEIDLARAALGAEYEIIDELGRGGMAIVYRALERRTGREVAIKVLPSQFAFDEGFVQRFQREGRIASQLEHPHIVPIYQVGRSGDVIYFVMKLLRGQSLGALLGYLGRMTAPDVRRILTETASALGHAARHGIVHRDVKPDNIVLDESGRCVMTDFGIARSASESKLTATGISVGTPRYMSPEQARSKPLDGRSDIYSLGIVGYECLVGRPPFDGEDLVAILMEHVKSPVPRPALATPEERHVYAVIERMLAKDPADRFQTADEVIAALAGEPLPQPAARGGDGAREAMLDAWLRALRAQQPKLRAGVVAAARAIGQGAARARHYAAARGRRFWAGLALGCVALAGGYYGVHVATMHRSRCPAASKAGSFVVLVDAVGAQRAGRDLDVYFDVCGLGEGTPYTASVTVTKSEGLRRLFGRSVGPVTARFDGSAGGPRTRRHETLDVDAMPPGSYTLSVVVTDREGRRRTRGTSFQLR